MYKRRTYNNEINTSGETGVNNTVVGVNNTVVGVGVNIVKKSSKYFQSNMIYRYFKNEFPFIEENIGSKIAGMIFDNEESFINELYHSIYNQQNEDKHFLYSLVVDALEVLIEYLKNGDNDFLLTHLKKYNTQLFEIILYIVKHKLEQLNTNLNDKIIDKTKLYQNYGELLYTKINSKYNSKVDSKIEFKTIMSKTLVCKIVGMFLELSEEELLDIFRFETIFYERCKEAIILLKNYFILVNKDDNNTDFDSLSLIELNTIYNAYFNK